MCLMRLLSTANQATSCTLSARGTTLKMKHQTVALLAAWLLSAAILASAGENEAESEPRSSLDEARKSSVQSGSGSPPGRGQSSWEGQVTGMDSEQQSDDKSELNSSSSHEAHSTSRPYSNEETHHFDPEDQPRILKGYGGGGGGWKLG